MTRHKSSLVVCLILVITASIGSSSAEVNVSLPLEGYYRAGKYFPARVVVNGEAAGSAITLEATGSIPVELQLRSGRLDRIVPWLAVTDTLREPQWSAAGVHHALNLPLHALGENERLVAFAGGDPDAAAMLFPGKTIIPIQLDRTGPLLEPAWAWGALDAVILDASAASRVDEARRAALIAAGTALAIRSDAVPDSRWPWRHEGPYWVLLHPSVGPQSLIQPTAYLPTYLGERSRPTLFQRQVIIYGVVFAILVLGVTLWRSRWAVAAMGLLAAGVAIDVVIWNGRQPNQVERLGAIEIRQGGLAQIDLWEWNTPLRAADSWFPVPMLTHPIFASLGHIEACGIHLVCDDGSPVPGFKYHLDRGMSLCFVMRSIPPGARTALLDPPTSSLRELAGELYARPGDRIMGQYFSQFGAEGHAFVVIVVDSPRVSQNPQ